MTYAVGDKVLVRELDDLAAEFGVYPGGLNTPYKIPKQFYGLCGQEATVVSAHYSIQKGIWQYDLADWDTDGGRRDLGFRADRVCPVHFSEEMLEPIKESIKPTFDEQKFFKMLGI